MKVDGLSKLDEFDRKNVDDIRNLSFINKRGEVVSLQQFATIEQTIGPSQLQRENRISAVTVSLGIAHRLLIPLSSRYLTIDVMKILLFIMKYKLKK